MKFETSLKLYEIKLKMRLFYMNKIKPRLKKIIIITSLILICAIVAIGIRFYINDHSRYFYIDYQGNKGVATWCGQTETGLVCDRIYGGKIIVTEYWKGK